MEALEPPLLTCESVIAEAAWHLGDSREAVDRLYGLLEAGALRIVPLLPDHIAHLRGSFRKIFADGFLRCGCRPPLGNAPTSHGTHHGCGAL
jgi:hypothetical protein